MKTDTIWMLWSWGWLAACEKALWQGYACDQENKRQIRLWQRDGGREAEAESRKAMGAEIIQLVSYYHRVLQIKLRGCDGCRLGDGAQASAANVDSGVEAEEPEATPKLFSR